MDTPQTPPPKSLSQKLLKTINTRRRILNPALDGFRNKAEDFHHKHTFQEHYRLKDLEPEPTEDY